MITLKMSRDNAYGRPTTHTVELPDDAPIQQVIGQVDYLLRAHFRSAMRRRSLNLSRARGQVEVVEEANQANDRNSLRPPEQPQRMRNVPEEVNRVLELYERMAASQAEAMPQEIYPQTSAVQSDSDEVEF